MTGKYSRARRVEAVNAAKDTAYHGNKMPEHFDERQKRIYDEYYARFLKLRYNHWE